MTQPSIPGHEKLLLPKTIYRWPKEVEECADALESSTVVIADLLLRAAVGKAAYLKIEGLDSNDERTQQQVSSEILDRVLGKPRSKLNPTEPTGEDVSKLSEEEKIARITVILKAAARRQVEGSQQTKGTPH